MAKPRVTIVGCGFVGTALGLALRNQLKDAEFIGHDKSSANTQRAEKMKAIDRSIWNLPASCEHAQLIILAIPQDAIEPTLRVISPDIMPGAIITDTTTLKSPLAEYVRKHVPAHASYISSDIVFDPQRVPPDQDIEQLTADIFKKAAWTLTPMSTASKDAVDSMTALVNETGAIPIFMDAVEHDGLRLAVDGIPAALSSTLMLAVTSDIAWRERQWLAGSTFGTATTSVATAHVEELAASLLAQPETTTHWLNQVMQQLIDLRTAVNQGNTEQVQKMLTGARDQRERWLTDWRRGREDGRVPTDARRPSMLSALIGSKLASRLEDSQRVADKDKPAPKKRR